MKEKLKYAKSLKSLKSLKLNKNGGTNATMTTTRQIVKSSQFVLEIARKFKEHIFEIKINLKNVHKYRKKYSRSKKNHHLSQLISSYELFVENTKRLYKLYNTAINNSRTLLGGKSKYGKLKGSGIFFDSKNDKAFNDIQRFLQLSYELLSNRMFLQDKNKVLKTFVDVLNTIHTFNDILKPMFIKLNQGNIVQELPSIPAAAATIKPSIQQSATKQPEATKQSVIIKSATKQPEATKQSAIIKSATKQPAAAATKQSATTKQSAERQTLKVFPQPTPLNPVAQIVACPRCNKQYKLTRTDDKDLLFNCSQCGTQIKATYKDTQTQMPSNRTMRQNQKQVRLKTKNYHECMNKCRSQYSRTNLSSNLQSRTTKRVRFVQ